MSPDAIWVITVSLACIMEILCSVVSTTSVSSLTFLGERYHDNMGTCSWIGHHTTVNQMKEGNVMNWWGSRKKFNSVSFSECLTPKVYSLLYLARRQVFLVCSRKKEKRLKFKRAQDKVELRTKGKLVTLDLWISRECCLEILCMGLRFISLPSKANLSHPVLWSSQRQPVIFFTNQSAVRDSDYRCATACIVGAWIHKSIELLRVHFCSSQMFLLCPRNLLQFSCKKLTHLPITEEPWQRPH